MKTEHIILASLMLASSIFFVALGQYPFAAMCAIFALAFGMMMLFPARHYIDRDHVVTREYYWVRRAVNLRALSTLDNNEPFVVMMHGRFAYGIDGAQYYSKNELVFIKHIERPE